MEDKSSNKALSFLESNGLVQAYEKFFNLNNFNRVGLVIIIFMGCACLNQKNKVSIIQDRNANYSNGNQASNPEEKEEKRKKMLEAAEKREKTQKIKGMTEKGLKEYEDKVKLQQKFPKTNYEPFDYN